MGALFYEDTLTIQFRRSKPEKTVDAAWVVVVVIQGLGR